jgi:hypothetical protein
LIHIITKRLEKVAEFPEMGVKVEFPDTLVVTLGHFNIFYKIFKDKIIITAFWDNRQDPKKLLQILR